MTLPASSFRVGRPRSLQVLINPLAENGLPNKSRDSNVSLGKVGGRTTSLLLLAEKYFKEAIFPNLLGRTCSSLQSSFNWTNTLKLEKLLGKYSKWFLAMSRTLSVLVISPQHTISGNSNILFPDSFSSTSLTSLMHSGISLITFPDKSTFLMFFSCKILLSILFKEILVACTISRDSGNPLMG